MVYESFSFPHPVLANPYGLLAVGGDLSSERLLLAYSFGIFPWYSEGQDILWWCPDPRCVLFLEKLKVSKSMRQILRKNLFRITMDQAFNQVIRACGKIKRKAQDGTWITKDMVQAYENLHKEGHAHSVEVWLDNQLVGGLYGLAIGQVFYGESMFSMVSNASKFAFIKLVKALQQYGYIMIDCQQDTAHLQSLGATVIPRQLFMQLLKKNQLIEETHGPWEVFQTSW